jgi:carboxypeptidase Q
MHVSRGCVTALATSSIVLWLVAIGSAQTSDFGVSTLTPQSVRGSDYLSFDDVGIPAFQFMQDRLEYNSRTHHSNMDVVDRVQRDDLVQMAIVVATFAYNTAIRDEKLPRKPMPAPAPPPRTSQP